MATTTTTNRTQLIDLGAVWLRQRAALPHDRGLNLQVWRQHVSEAQHAIEEHEAHRRKAAHRAMFTAAFFAIPEASAASSAPANP
eukprot:CAMPEP_0171810678 /NCGR_PEP_ID=MMETSP0991-20121206/77690_1 /TAXON_ID=483369 /ORGANISM="non described non described, Strain CCMP2098" /LENGTH=84 /DNA_ID=CAMNT_0012423969 /DNA_START=196 /DNA_END=451 /DNA_ORIENTATION=-